MYERIRAATGTPLSLGKAPFLNTNPSKVWPSKNALQETLRFRVARVQVRLPRGEHAGHDEAAVRDAEAHVDHGLVPARVVRRDEPRDGVGLAGSELVLELVPIFAVPRHLGDHHAAHVGHRFGGKDAVRVEPAKRVQRAVESGGCAHPRVFEREPHDPLVPAVREVAVEGETEERAEGVECDDRADDPGAVEESLEAARATSAGEREILPEVQIARCRRIEQRHAEHRDDEVEVPERAVQLDDEHEGNDRRCRDQAANTGDECEHRERDLDDEEAHEAELQDEERQLVPVPGELRRERLVDEEPLEKARVLARGADELELAEPEEDAKNEQAVRPRERRVGCRGCLDVGEQQRGREKKPEERRFEEGRVPGKVQLHGHVE